MDIEISKLRAIICGAIEPTISLYRKHAVKTILFKIDSNPTVKKSEVDDFLLSIPYFDKTLSYYLMGNGRIGNMDTKPWVNEEWIYNFNKKVSEWAGSKEWLYGELLLIHLPGYCGKKKIFCDRIYLPSLIQIIFCN